MTETEYESEYTNGIITKRCIRCDGQKKMGRYKWLPGSWGTIYFGVHDAPSWSLCGSCLEWFKANSPGMQERMAAECAREREFAEQQKPKPSFEFTKLGQE